MTHGQEAWGGTCFPYGIGVQLAAQRARVTYTCCGTVLHTQELTKSEFRGEGGGIIYTMCDVCGQQQLGALNSWTTNRQLLLLPFQRML